MYFIVDSSVVIIIPPTMHLCLFLVFVIYVEYTDHVCKIKVLRMYICTVHVTH